MFTIKLSHISRARNVFFDPIHHDKRPERYIDDIEKINTTPAIILAKGLRDALFMNRPAVRDVILSLKNLHNEELWNYWEIDETKIHSLDESAVQDILVQLSTPQEEQGV